MRMHGPRGGRAWAVQWGGGQSRGGGAQGPGQPSGLRTGGEKSPAGSNRVDVTCLKGVALASRPADWGSANKAGCRKWRAVLVGGLAACPGPWLTAPLSRVRTPGTKTLRPRGLWTAPTLATPHLGGTDVCRPQGRVEARAGVPGGHLTFPTAQAHTSWLHPRNNQPHCPPHPQHAGLGGESPGTPAPRICSQGRGQGPSG